MKYDITKPQTKGAKRVLDSVGSAFFNLLTEKDFADISINEVCDRAGYPRATFYNYFDDKYDLLNYLWYSVTKEINLEEYADIAPPKTDCPYSSTGFIICSINGRSIYKESSNTIRRTTIL